MGQEEVFRRIWLGESTKTKRSINIFKRATDFYCYVYPSKFALLKIFSSTELNSCTRKKISKVESKKP